MPAGAAGACPWCGHRVVVAACLLWAHWWRVLSAVFMESMGAAAGWRRARSRWQRQNDSVLALAVASAGGEGDDEVL
jgi:hypothetical protein